MVISQVVTYGRGECDGRALVVPEAAHKITFRIKQLNITGSWTIRTCCTLKKPWRKRRQATLQSRGVGFFPQSRINFREEKDKSNECKEFEVHTALV
jgi:hypothetical protein